MWNLKVISRIPILRCLTRIGSLLRQKYPVSLVCQSDASHSLAMNFRSKHQERVTRNRHPPQRKGHAYRGVRQMVGGRGAFGLCHLRIFPLPTSLGNRWCWMFKHGRLLRGQCCFVEGSRFGGDVNFYSSIMAEGSQHQHPSREKWRRRGSGSFV